MPEPKPVFNAYLRYSSLGIEMVLGVLVGVWLGQWADKHWAIAPWGTLGGMVLGLGVAAKAVVRAVKQASKDADNQP